jgi:hypothetical protein
MGLMLKTSPALVSAELNELLAGAWAGQRMTIPRGGSFCVGNGFSRRIILGVSAFAACLNDPAISPGRSLICG